MKQPYTYWLIARGYLVLLMLAVLLGFVARGTAANRTLPLPYPAATTGYDVSWPNCRAVPPTSDAWGVVGVTGGLVFSENPCLQTEASWFRTPTLYVNTGYAGIQKALRFAHSPRRCASQDEQCLAYNYGYNAGLYATEQAFSHRLYSRMWWLDVETENSWSDDPEVNRQALRGTADAIRHQTAGATIGYYSYPAQWDHITGSWRPGNPSWVATGTASREAAVEACSQSGFTGGPVWLAQYVLALDHDYSCPTI